MKTVGINTAKCSNPHSVEQRELDRRGHGYTADAFHYQDMAIAASSA